MAENGQIQVSPEALVVASVLFDRYKLAKQAGSQYGGARDLWEQFGYPEDIDTTAYHARYNRDGLSARIVDKPALDTWRHVPIVKDGDQEDTKFVMEFGRIADRLRLWHHLSMVDRLAGIGQFGVLLIGVKGEAGLEQEVPVRLAGGADDLIYLRAYAEGEVEVDTVEDDPTNARFGQPLLYKIDLGESAGKSLGTRRVHYSRILHVAEDSPDGVYGRPRLKKSFNRLMDMDKVIGSSAEAFWRLILPGYALTEKEGYGIENTQAEIESEMQDFIHNLKRYLVLEGVNVDELGISTAPDPSAEFKTLISLIAADIDMPQNILIGSEQGIRASDVDAQNWAGRIQNRQTQFAEPIILRGIIDWLLAHAALPMPIDPEGYSVEWPPLYEQDQQAEASTNKDRMAILQAAVVSGVVEVGLASPQEVRELALLPPEPEGLSMLDLLGIEDRLAEPEPEVEDVVAPDEVADAAGMD